MNHLRGLESKIYDKIFTRNTSAVNHSVQQQIVAPHPALSSSPPNRRSNGEDHILIIGEEPQSPLLEYSQQSVSRSNSSKHSPQQFELEIGAVSDSESKRSAPMKVQGQKMKQTEDEINTLMHTIYDQLSGSFQSTTPNSSGSESSAASSVLNSLASSLGSFKSGGGMLDTFAQQFLTPTYTNNNSSRTKQHGRTNSDQTFFEASQNGVESGSTVIPSTTAVSCSLPSHLETKSRTRSKTVFTTQGAKNQKKPPLPKQKYFKAHAVEESDEESDEEEEKNKDESTSSAPQKKPLSSSYHSDSSSSKSSEHLSTKTNKKEMLLLFLLRHICNTINPDPQFFVNTCKKLHSEGYISDLHNCDLVFMKEQSKDFMLDFINTWPVAFNNEDRCEHTSAPSESDFSAIKKSVSQDSYLDRMTSRDNTKEMTSNIPFFNSMFLNMSRVKTDFKNRKILGKGAFGHVFQMEHKIDGVSYAVKRIKLSFRDFSQFEEEYNRVIREVKALASLIHPNIVAYNNCWFELCSHTDSVLDHQSRPFNQTDRYSFHPSMSNDGSAYSEDAAATTPSTPTTEKSVNKSLLVPYKQTHSRIISASSEIDHPDFIFEFEKESTSVDPTLVRDGLNYTVETESNATSRKGETQTNHLMLQDSMGNDLIAEDALKSFLSTIYNEKNKRFEIYLFIQMQLCENYTLQDWLWSDERVKENQVDLRKILMYFYQIADAVSYVHSKGIIHRDLKPSNIFLSRAERNEIRIGDFGLSKFVKPSTPGKDSTPNTPLYEATRMFSKTSSFENPFQDDTHSGGSSNHTSGLGTVTYASPEQLNQCTYDSKSDIFSLGIILYEMLHAFKTKTERAFVLQDLRKGKYAPHILTAFPSEMEVVKRCLALETSNRPSAEEIKQMVLKIQYERKFVDLPCGLLSSSPEEKSSQQLEEEIKILEQQLQRLTAQLKNKQK